MSLLEDLINEKRKNTNVKTKTEKFIDIYSVRKNLVSTKNVLDLIETNKKKFQKFDYQIENIEERSIDIVVKVNSNRTFEVYDLILFIKKELSEYISSFKNRNPIQNSNEEWINLSKNNIKYNFSYLLNYIFIFIGVIITNIILNVIDQKIYTINRSRFLLNREFDFILNVHNSNSIQKKLFQIINYNLESDKIIFLIINSNKYLLEQIKKYQNSNNLKKIMLMNYVLLCQ